MRGTKGVGRSGRPVNNAGAARDGRAAACMGLTEFKFPL